MTVCFLRIGAGHIEDAERYSSVARAVKAYTRYAHDCMRYGSTPGDATLHIAATHDELHEYPDWVLSIGPKGGLIKERCY